MRQEFYETRKVKDKGGSPRDFLKGCVYVEEKFYLILAKNSAQMLLINKLLRENGIETDLVPSPPESGTVCAIAIKIQGVNLEKAKNILLKIRLK